MSDSPSFNNPFQAPKEEKPPSGPDGPKVIPSSLSTPAMILIVLAMLGIVFSIAMMVLQPVLMDAMQDFMLNMVPEDQKQELQDEFAKQQENPLSSPIVNWISTGVVVILYCVMLYGGLQMKKGGSFGWAMAAAIIAMIPCSPCCILELPAGIWALIVLVKPEIKQLFGSIDQSVV